MSHFKEKNNSDNALQIKSTFWWIKDLLSLIVNDWKFRINFCENVQKSRKFLHLKYLDGIIPKASNEVNALSRVTPFMSFPKKKNIHAFFS